MSTPPPASPLESEAASGLAVEWLGLVPYAEALDLQLRCVAERAAGRAPDRLLLLEHPTVITLGRSARRENLLSDPADLARRGVEIHEVQRGGDVTFHAPGQLVGYLIADLQARGEPDVHALLRQLEDGLIETCEAFGVPARRLDGMTGVYVDRERSRRSARPERKLASIGIGVKRWISFHGFALNVDLDLAGFADIVPCGLEQVEMSSLEREREEGDTALGERVRETVAAAFRSRFA